MTDHPPTPCWHLLTFVQPPTSYLPRLVNVVCERPLIPFILSDKDLDGAEQSLRHFLDKFIQWHFHTSSKEVCLKKNSNYMQGLKSAILAIFQTGPGWPCPISTALKNPLLDFKKYFCFGFLWIPRKIERPHFFKILPGKITVWSMRRRRSCASISNPSMGREPRHCNHRIILLPFASA